jgi:serine/threonine protein kinase
LTQESSGQRARLTIESFENLDQIGEGTYGKVFKAKLKPHLVPPGGSPYRALKKFKLDQEQGGFPITSTREIQILKLVDHENVVKLEDIIIESSNKGVKER